MERIISRHVLRRGKSFVFRYDEVELPNGRRTVRDIVEHPGASAMVPILPDGRIVLVRQYRYAVGKELLEIPAGTIDGGETPLECARRELAEETGYEAESMEELLRFYTAPGYSSELIHVFAARGLRKGEGQMEPDESIEAEAFELEEIMEMINSRIIEDAKTICGILSLSCLRGV